MSPHAVSLVGDEEQADVATRDQTARQNVSEHINGTTKKSLLRPYDEDELHDLVCVGFGPASLAIAVALHDALQDGLPHLRTHQPKVRFLERQSRFAWHPGMLLPGAKMQITFLKDLATLRNPRSQFTFLNYLFEKNRLVQFTNLSTFLPHRVEYEDYMKWCASWFEDVVDYDRDCVSVEADHKDASTGSVAGFRVTSVDRKTGRQSSIRAKHVVIAAGGRPVIPDCLPSSHPRIIHSSQYATSVSELFRGGRQPRSVAVIGGGQSAAEVFNNIPSRFPDAKVCLLIRGSALRPSDDSPFVNEIFDPQRVDQIYAQSPDVRSREIANDKATNYSVVRLELLEHIYTTMYSYRLQYADESQWPQRILSHRTVTGVEDCELGDEPALRLHINNSSDISADWQKPTTETLTVDLVVVASGYRRDAHEDLLKGLRDLMPGGGGDGQRWRVRRDYGVEFDKGSVSEDAGIWLQGCNEQTHGLSDSLLSILANRGGEMVQNIFGAQHAEGANGHRSTAKKAPATKAKVPVTRVVPKRAAAEPKKKVAKPATTTRKAAPKKAATSVTTAATKRGTKRKAEDEAEAPPAKKPAAARKIAPLKKPAAKKTAAVTKTKAATIEKTTSTRKKQTEVPVPAAKQPAPKKAATTRKRKATDEAPAAPAKKVKVLKKCAVINEPPIERLNVYVFGEGSAGELGLGTSQKAIDVKRPRPNFNLAADKVGVVQVVAGGMHVIALTHDNKILTWGVNDQGALGRDTTWNGGLKNVDAAGDDSDEEEDDNGLNPKESIPGEVDFSATEVAEGARFVQVAAGDSCSFALTDDGRVYGWGTFRGNEGLFGFNPHTEIAHRPILNPDVKKITSITAGANHVLALDSNGAVFAWGSGQQNQLGRRIVERTKLEGLKAREFGLPKGAKKGIVSIMAGSYHNFAIDRAGNVYGWGLNNFGQTGITGNAGEDDALILKPQIIDALKGKTIISIEGGGHHSLCATSDGDCLIWGRVDGNQMGIAADEIAKMSDDAVIKDDKGEPRIIRLPQKVTAIQGAVTHVASSSDHNVVITKEGKAWSWGFSSNYQTGQGQVEDVEVATMIDNTATRDVELNGATTGGQFSIVTAAAME
ncbi:hypothetical protein B0A55_04579 [Friedmanniomyces simplex]|uniref:L-ornithine N(5)-monooxygenase [NAD(P)H] n=1 Tax=Friedmanniomyces simplex TaxID=329884 RepID=A0A4U0XEX2_9PEZI|nr:hypothetical protein B0A55_04579 [Friedmanniomyces simplex]